MLWRWMLALALAAAPATAGEPERQMLAALQAVDARVATIGHRLAVAGARRCGADARSLAGFAVHALDQYAPELHADAAAALGLGRLPAVLAVVPASAAARAGLRPADAILSIDGVALVPRQPAKRADYARTAAIEQRIEDGLADGRLELTVLRDGREHRLSIAGERGCPSRVQLVPGKKLNASADGDYVQLTTGLVAFTRSDDELALVIAHELGHNILDHKERLDAQGVSRGLFRAFGKNPARIRATENEADRLALHLMHAAGYDIGVAPAFWDRFGRETDRGIFADGTHASRKQRVAIAQEEIAAIRAASD